MNDTELDRLLDTWQAPPPRRSLREELRARFPRAERRRALRPLAWVLAIAVASLTLAIGMEQAGTNPWDFQIGDALNQFHMHLVQMFDAHRAGYIVSRIRESDPRVYVDGQPAPPLQFGRSATMIVQVPGDAAYTIISLHFGLKGWVKAGRIHENVIEFQAGARQVRIECSRSITGDDRPVFARRRE